MKQYVYILLNEDGGIEAVYDSKDLAEKLLAPIEAKLGTTVTIKKQMLNPQIDIVGL